MKDLLPPHRLPTTELMTYSSFICAFALHTFYTLENDKMLHGFEFAYLFTLSIAIISGYLESGSAFDENNELTGEEMEAITLLLVNIVLYLPQVIYTFHF